MLKLSKSRKKDSLGKLTHSRTKAVKNRPKVQHIRLSAHHASTHSLIANVNHNSSQCSLVDNKAGQKKKSGANLSKNRQSSVSLPLKGKKKKADKKSKGKGLNQQKSTQQQSRTKIVVPATKSRQNQSKNSPHRAPAGNKSHAESSNRQDELYERVNIGLYNSKTNSQINFSNASSIRDRENQPNHQNSHAYKKKKLTIDCSDEFILNQYFTNSRIKFTERVRVEAAIKIQKVFRGYLTRKMLQSYIENEEVKLKELSMLLRNSDKDNEQPKTPRQSDNSSDEYKRMRREAQEQFFRQEEEFGPEHDISLKEESNFRQKNPPRVAGGLEDQSSIFNDNFDSLHKYLSIDDSELPFQESHIEDQRVPVSDYKAENSEEQFKGIQQISGIGSLKKQDRQQADQSIYSEEAVNIERVDNSSRYVSYEEAKEKIRQREQLERDNSKEAFFKCTPNISSEKQEFVPTDFSEKRIQEFQTESQDTSKNYITNNKVPKRTSRQRTREEEERTNYAQSQLVERTFVSNLNSKEKELITLLKREEKEKWGKIIEMLKMQMDVAKVRNDDMEKIMNEILEFSKKNKEQLENSSRSLDRSGQKAKEANQNTTLVASAQKLTTEKHNDLKEEEESSRFFPAEGASKMKKKKPLLIDIDGLEKSRFSSEGEEDRRKKNEDMPLVRRRNIKKSTSVVSLQEKTEELKKFYQKNMSVYPIEDMIYIREKALEKREKAMLNALNEQLQNSKVSHENFLSRLATMQQLFSEEKQLINKAKMQIFMGNKAAHKMMHDSFLDARYLGYKVTFSQSYRQFKGNGNLWIKEIIVDELKSFSQTHSKKAIESEQNQSASLPLNDSQQPEEEPAQNMFSHSKERIQNQSMDQESRSISFSQNSQMMEEISYQQYDVENQNLDSRPNFVFEESFQSSEEQMLEASFQNEKFRKISPQSKKAAALPIGHYEDRQQDEPRISRKMGLNFKPGDFGASLQSFQTGNNLKRYEMTPRNAPRAGQNRAPSSEVYNISFEGDSSSDGDLLFDEESDIPINQISQERLEALIWQAVGEFYENSHLRINLVKSKNTSPPKISSQEGLDFIQFILKAIPPFEELSSKLNQKMAPSRMELLKFMRVILYDDDMEGSNSSESDAMSNMEQIGKYELILSPEICLQAIESYLESERERQNMRTTTAVVLDQRRIRSIFENRVSEDCIKKAISREKLSSYNQNQKSELRLEIKKIEMHCIFEAFNELLMKRRMTTQGYSGIGLNELSMLFCREPIEEITSPSTFTKMLKSSEEALKDLVGGGKSSNDKLLLQNYEQLYMNDSQWICYSDEALSFALELVFMLEDQILCIETAEIGKVFGFQLSE